MSKSSGGKTFYRVFTALVLAFSLVVLVYFAVLMTGSGASRKTYSDPVVSSVLRRGTIYDRNGQILALDIPYLQVSANPRQITDPEGAAAVCAGLLGITTSDAYEKLSAGNAYQVLKRKIDYSQKDRIVRTLKEAGLWGAVYIEEYEGRYYPSNFHASQILGFTDTDGNGIEGIELAMDSVLSAVPELGKQVSYGSDVYLTLDINLQYLCDSVIQDMCAEHDPDYAVLILMDAKSGDILASVSYPWYNPNSYNLSTDDQRQNKAFAFMYEPGSVFKVYSLATCLEAGQADFDTPYTCTGTHNFVTPGGRTLTISCHEAHGTLDYQGMIGKSCNGAIANWALQTDDDLFYRGLCAFHFAGRYDVGLYNASGTLASPEDWSFRSKPTISFGQEMMATPLQLTAAATVFTNGGVLLSPRLVEKTVSPDGTETVNPNTDLGQVVSAETAAKVLEAMKTATQSGGTAIKTSVEGLEVAAKTGTAEILNSATGAVTASTLAIFPADDPMYIIYIAASNPKGSTIWGANIAAPAIGSLIDAMVSAGRVPNTLYTVTQ